MESIPQETSRRITSLRFLLAMLVVFVHNNFTPEQIEKLSSNGNTTVFCQSAAGAWIQRIISSGIAGAAVPLFFMFAAYLQARKEEPYKIMLKKKSRSLLLPYLAWLAVYFVWAGPMKLAVAKSNPSALGHPENLFIYWNAKNWIEFVLGIFTEYGHPAFAAQFWFLRDLILFTVLSPIFMRLIRLVPAGFFALVTSLYFFGSALPMSNHFWSPLFYYVAGLYWGTFNFPIFESIERIRWAEIVPLFAAAALAHFIISENPFSQCMVLFAIAILIKTSTMICKHKKSFALAEYLADFSFFLYAIHMPALLYMLQKIWLHFLPMKNGFLCLAEYFGVNILTIAIGTGIGIALKKYCPPLFNIFNGGRKQLTQSSTKK